MTSKNIMFLALSMILFNMVCAQDSKVLRVYQNDSVDILHVSGPIYMIRPEIRIGNPSSVISVGEDGILMVDANLSEVGPAILKRAKEFGRDKVDIILTTHYHADHTQGLEFYGSDAIKITTVNQRKRLLTEGLIGDDDFMKKEGLPEITFETSISIHFNNEEIQITTSAYIYNWEFIHKQIIPYTKHF